MAEKALQELSYSQWKENWIGTGKINHRARRAMNCAYNLVHKHQRIRFQNMLDTEHKDYRPENERILYDVFKSVGEDAEKKAFEAFVQTFGGNYDTIAYLFFVKDSSRFLPISPGNFEKSLRLIGVDYSLRARCSWDNYNGFISIIKEVRLFMQDLMPDVDIRLIDAHSFLWVINEKGRKTDFQNWVPDGSAIQEIEKSAENYLAFGTAARKSRLSQYISRSSEVVKLTKERAKGVCQLCGKPAPFSDKNGNPYLESHHIIWLSRGGMDSTNNTAALCPNCHTKMHVVDDARDVQKLQSIIKGS